MLRLFGCLLFFVIFRLLLLLQQTSTVGDPRVAFELMETPDVLLFDAIVFLVFLSEVEEVVDIVELVMGLVDVLFEALELEINFEALLSTDVTLRLLVFLRCILLLAQL